MVAALRRPSTKAARFDTDSRAATLQASLERRILHGLAAEWENALWLLPDSLRRPLRRPLFDIRDMHRRLGCWDGGKREIALSRELVSGHRWDDVREVLLHEMAHQVAHEGMQAALEPDHGKSFQQACRLLRANPAASGTYRPLHVRLQEGEQLSPLDRIVAKIQKLMALGESSNPHEANAAMRKAYYLIAQYNVDRITRGEEGEYYSIFLGTPRLRHFREAYHLAHLLQDFYFVQGMWVQAWALEKGKMGRVLEISGIRRNVLIAEYIHDSVCRYIDTAWTDYCRGKGLNRYRKSDFALGVIEGFKATLQQTCTSGETGSRLPVQIEDQALTSYLARRYPHVRSFSRKSPGLDERVLADGTARGRKLVIAKGITRNDGFKGRALDAPGDN